MSESVRLTDPTGPVPAVLGTLETEVMNQLWSQGEATVRSVLKAVNASAAKPRAYNTVLTVMRRLHRKGFAVRRRDGRAHVYGARLSRDAYRDGCVEVEAAVLVSRFGQAALVAFARELDRMGPERRRTIQRLARARDFSHTG